MTKRNTVMKYLLTALAILSLSACQKKGNSMAIIPLESESVLEMDGALHGLAANPQTGDLFFGHNGNTVLKRSASGLLDVFAVLPEATGRYDHRRKQAYLFDLHRLPDGTFLGAAKDSIVKIDQSGKVTPVAGNLFAGTYGVSGITADSAGTVYLSIHGRGIFKLEPGQKDPIPLLALPGVLGVELSPDEKYLYICDNDRNKLIVSDTKGKRKPLELDLPLAPEYLFIDNNRLFVKGPQTDSWLVFDITRNGKPVPKIRYDVSGIRKTTYGIQTSVLLNENGKEVLYGTCWDSGELYRIQLP